MLSQLTHQKDKIMNGKTFTSQQIKQYIEEIEDYYLDLDIILNTQSDLIVNNYIPLYFNWSQINENTFKIRFETSIGGAELTVYANTSDMCPFISKSKLYWEGNTIFYQNIHNNRRLETSYSF